MKKLLKMISPLNAQEEMPVTLYIVKKILAFLLIFLVSALLAEGLTIIAHYIMGYDVLRGEMLSTQTMTLMKYYGYIVFLFITILYCKFIEKRSARSMGFNSRISRYITGSLIGIILLTVSIGIITLTGSIIFQGFAECIDFPIIIAFLGAFIVQGAMEETICRGFLMTSLSKRVHLPIAIFISSFAFAIPHLLSLFSGNFLINLLGIINMLLVSAIFSLLLVNDKNIWIACGMHSIWNFFLLNVFGLNLSGADVKTTSIFVFDTNGENILNGGAYGIEASIITTVVLATYVVILILKYKKIVRI